MESPITDPTVVLGEQLYAVRFDLESIFKLESLGIQNDQLAALMTGARKNPVSNISMLASACLYTVPGDEQITLTPAQIVKAIGKTPGDETVLQKFSTLAKAVIEAYTKVNLASAAPAKASSEPAPQVQ